MVPAISEYKRVCNCRGAGSKDVSIGPEGVQKRHSPEWIHERGQCATAVGEAREALRMEEDLVLGHDGTKQQHDVSNAQLLEQLSDGLPGYGQCRRQWRLQRLLITRSD